DDVEPCLLLVADDGVRGVVEGLLVLDLLERDPHVAAAELVAEPALPRVGADHRGRENGVDDLLRHLAPPVARSPTGGLLTLTRSARRRLSLPRRPQAADAAARS